MPRQLAGEQGTLAKVVAELIASGLRAKGLRAFYEVVTQVLRDEHGNDRSVSHWTREYHAIRADAMAAYGDPVEGRVRADERKWVKKVAAQEAAWERDGFRKGEKQADQVEIAAATHAESGSGSEEATLVVGESMMTLTIRGK